VVLAQLLEETQQGTELLRSLNGMTYEAARPIWVTLSERLAQNVSGEVHVFLNSCNPSAIFYSVEWPILRDAEGLVFIWHIMSGAL
jgi:hypothetical protein